MAYRSFSVGPAKGLLRASAEDLPNLVIVAGPNGAGKSTLLHQLSQHADQAEPGTEVIYVPPHRPWLKSTLYSASMYQRDMPFRQLLGLPQLPGWEMQAPQGLNLIGQQPRHPDTWDEALALVKFAIAKIEFRHLKVLERTYREHGREVPAGSIPDIYAPMRRLTKYLLPHLEFDRVDLTNDRDIKCLFRRVDGDLVVDIDIDDLSSGEKAVVALFLPFLETQINRLLELETAADPGVPIPAALIDEPDLHLHPTLQVSLLDYMRSLTQAGEAKFIITTHSTTIVDAASVDELFMVAPLSSVSDGNQFVRIGTTEERLEAIRSLTGSTHLITRCRPIIFHEGERAGTTRSVSDQRLIEMLVPEAASFVLVAASGRNEVVRSATQLREAASSGLPGVAVFALVDADQQQASDPDYVLSWPVAMIENLLLDAGAIWQVIEAQREIAGLAGPDSVEADLRSIAAAQRDNEIRLRVKAAAPPIRVDIAVHDETMVDSAIAEAGTAVAGAIANLGGPEALRAVIQEATQSVDRILTEGRELEAFHGKNILRAFHERHVHALGMGYQPFVYAVARWAAGGRRLERLTSDALMRIQNYLPPDLIAALEAANASLPEGAEKDASAEALLQAKAARSAWEAGAPDTTDRPRLRSLVVETARALTRHGLVELRAPLVKCAVEIGAGAHRNSEASGSLEGVEVRHDA